MRVLILQQFIQHFSGSEITSMQICEALKSMGFDAEIGTFFHKSPMRDLVMEKGIKVINLLEDKCVNYEYDLVWAHHAPILAYLLFHEQVADTRILFSSLSAIDDLGTPPVFLNEIDYYLSLSDETTEVLRRKGVPVERIHNFPNFVSEKIFGMAKNVHSEVPKKIAVVSNHPPLEVREFAELARNDGIIVDFFGLQDKPIFIDENILKEYDLVITIGKTVQFCFGLKIPVYCYDHFGGPGFINESNYELSKSTNFSGRLSGIKKVGRELFSDIYLNYSKSLRNLEFLNSECQQNYCLESNLNVVINDILQIPKTNVKELKERNLVAQSIYDLYIHVLRDNYSLLSEVNEAISDIKVLRDTYNQEVNEIVQFYENSKSWRITRPLRKLTFFFGKKNNQNSEI